MTRFLLIFVSLLAVLPACGGDNGTDFANPNLRSQDDPNGQQSQLPPAYGPRGAQPDPNDPNIERLPAPQGSFGPQGPTFPQGDPRYGNDPSQFSPPGTYGPSGAFPAPQGTYGPNGTYVVPPQRQGGVYDQSQSGVYVDPNYGQGFAPGYAPGYSQGGFAPPVYSPGFAPPVGCYGPGRSFGFSFQFRKGYNDWNDYDDFCAPRYCAPRVCAPQYYRRYQQRCW